MKVKFVFQEFAPLDRAVWYDGKGRQGHMDASVATRAANRISRFAYAKKSRRTSDGGGRWELEYWTDE